MKLCDKYDITEAKGDFKQRGKGYKVKDTNLIHSISENLF